MRIGLRIAAGMVSPVSATVAGEEQVTPQTLVKVDDFAVTNLHLALFASQTGHWTTMRKDRLRCLNELVNSVMVANPRRAGNLRRILRWRQPRGRTHPPDRTDLRAQSDAADRDR